MNYSCGYLFHLLVNRLKRLSSGGINIFGNQVLVIMIEELILIRHGESRHHVEDISGGWTDMHLTDRGVAQAVATANRLQVLLSDCEFTLFSSDLLRASDTAEKISSLFKKEIIYLKDLRELNNGVAAGLSNDDARKIMTPPSEPLADWIPFEGGESWRMLYSRVTNVLQEISSLEERRAVVVSHGNALICLISIWLGIQLEQRISYDLHTCNITWLRVNDWGECTIRKLNDCGHLAVLGLENMHEYH